MAAAGAIAGVGSPATAAPGPVPTEAGFSWVRRSGAGHGTPWLAVAARQGGAGEAPTVAVGDADGIAVLDPSGTLRRVARLPGVTDLAFDGSGRLWAATLRGLFATSPRTAEPPRDRGPGAGEKARAVARIAWRGRVGLVATGQGAFASLDGRSWSRLPGPLSSLAIDAVALAPVAPSGSGCGARGFVAAGGDLYRAVLDCEPGRPSGLRATIERMVPPVGRPLGVAPVDLSTDWPEVELAVLYPQHLALLLPSGRAGEGPVVRSPEWRVARLPLPPGASARRLGQAGRWHWVGHDRGLVRARSASGPWWRAAAPAGRLAVLALAASGPALYAATEAGLLEGRAREPWASPSDRRAPASGDRRHAAAEPDIRAVHAAAVRHLDLGPRRWRERFAGLRRRGWLPTLSLEFDVTDDSDRSRDDDQAFISGETRFLQDRDHRRGRQYRGGVELRWDLPSLAYDDQWDDLSREVRQLIALRDDVLDEVNQLYFERRRILEDLAARTADDAERPMLVLRAAELAAGLDAWTGGWFGAQLRRAAGDPSLLSPRPAKEKP